MAIRASGVAAGKQRRNERPRQKLSNTLGTAFFLEAFEEALRTTGTAPKLFNTEPGCQFTSRAWRECLEGHGVRLSMDGKGRWVDKSLRSHNLYELSSDLCTKEQGRRAAVAPGPEALPWANHRAEGGPAP